MNKVYYLVRHERHIVLKYSNSYIKHTNSWKYFKNVKDKGQLVKDTSNDTIMFV